MKKFQHILDRRKLRLVEILRSPDGGLRRSWILLCKDKHDKKLIVKIFDSKDPYARKRFIDEIRNTKLVRESVGLAKRRLFPKVRYQKITDVDGLYYIYDYFEGIPIGEFSNDFGIALGIFGKDNFKTFLDSILTISNLRIRDKELIKRVYTFDRVQKEFEVYKSAYEGYASGGKDTKDISNFLYSIRTTVFNRKNMVTCQTDLYPANIFVNRSGGKIFKFLDWEYLSSAPIGFLPAFMYLLFWKEEFWRAKIYSYFYDYYVHKRGYSESVFNKSFRFCIVILGLRLWYQSRSLLDNNGSGELKKSSMATFSYFLEVAIDGSIVKPSNIKFYVRQGDLQKVSDKYKLGNILKHTIYYSGRGNTVAKVETEDGGKYIFRFYYKNRSSDMIRNELSIYDKLSSNGICTYKVFKSPDDELFININLYGRNRRVAVLSFLEGSRIKRRWDSVRTTKTLGKTLANIHKLRVSHNDFSKENILFVKGKLTGIIDFEWGKFTDKPFMYENDLAKAITLWLIDVRGKSVPGDEFIYNFILGYYNELPKKRILEKILLRIERKIDKEKKIAEDIFYKHASVKTREKGLRRFIYAKADVNKFRNDYI